MGRLTRAFFNQDTVSVARALLGQRLVRVVDGQRLSGLICETEAYLGAGDEASHAYRRTPRSAIMYGPPGYAYVYFIYGMYYCLNAVTEAENHPGAVLIRAIVPQEGIALMRERRMQARKRPSRPIPDHQLADGPGKLCLALNITRALNGIDLITSHELFIEAAPLVQEQAAIATPRIGVRGDDVARNRPWRFLYQPSS